jgi:hypothetical protein
MTKKASAGSAMLFAAGLLLAVAGPAPALAAGTDGTAVSNTAAFKEDAASSKPAEAEAGAAGATASDQLSDADRDLQEAPVVQAPATQGVVLASTSRASAEASNDSSTLDKTSLIGKIFIAFGALLTVASAARMLMA